MYSYINSILHSVEPVCPPAVAINLPLLMIRILLPANLSNLQLLRSNISSSCRLPVSMSIGMSACTWRVR